MSVLYPYFGGICTHMYLMGDMSEMSVLNVLYEETKNSPEVLVKLRYLIWQLCVPYFLYFQTYMLYILLGVYSIQERALSEYRRQLKAAAVGQTLRWNVKFAGILAVHSKIYPIPGMRIYSSTKHRSYLGEYGQYSCK